MSFLSFFESFNGEFTFMLQKEGGYKSYPRLPSYADKAFRRAKAIKETSVLLDFLTLPTAAAELGATPVQGIIASTSNTTTYFLVDLSFCGTNFLENTSLWVSFGSTFVTSRSLMALNAGLTIFTL